MLEDLCKNPLRSGFLLSEPGSIEQKEPGSADMVLIAEGLVADNIVDLSEQVDAW